MPIDLVKVNKWRSDLTLIIEDILKNVEEKQKEEKNRVLIITLSNISGLLAVCLSYLDDLAETKFLLD